ncbi:hypothetical protein KW805_02045 [Candidatus Pacearchaeota archaeon]|nr:hypothetical protein [Candidatus Pacearchaeota archaeon]
MEGFILIKPDYVQHTTYLRSLASDLIRDQKLDLIIKNVEHVESIPRQFMEEFYSPHRDAPHFPKVINYWSDQSSAVLWLEGQNVFSDTFKLAGTKTDPMECDINEIRWVAKHLIPHQYIIDSNERKLRNIVHRSDSDLNREREMSLLKKLLKNE